MLAPAKPKSSILAVLYQETMERTLSWTQQHGIHWTAFRDMMNPQVLTGINIVQVNKYYEQDAMK